MSEASLGSIILYDEDENELEFDVMDKFCFDGETYYVLLPIDYDAEDVEFVILREMSADGGTALVGIEDADTLDRVFDEYKKRQAID